MGLLGKKIECPFVKQHWSCFPNLQKLNCIKQQWNKTKPRKKTQQKKRVKLETNLGLLQNWF